MQVRAQAVDLATYLPITNTVVRMAVLPGGASPAGTAVDCGSGGCRTDNGGKVAGSYANTTAAGNDAVRAHLDLDSDAIVDPGEPTADATIPWVMRSTVVTPGGPYEVNVSTVGVGAKLSWTYRVDCSQGGYGGGCKHFTSPVAGRTLDFYTLGGEFLCSAVTGADGVGRCGLPTHKLAVIQSGGQLVQFSGDALHNPTSAVKQQ